MEGTVAKRGEGAVRADRMETGCNFPDALRLMQGGCQVRREGWDSSMLYVSRNAELNRVDLVIEDRDADGPYCFANPWLGGGAIGGPPVEDLLAEDWRVVEDPAERVPTVDGGDRATAAQLAEIDAEDDEVGPAPGAVGCGAER